MNTLPAHLRFPKPPVRIDRTLMDSPPNQHAVADYISNLRSWRLAVLEFLRTYDETTAILMEGLSKRARAALATFLASSWTETMTQWAAHSPYNLRAFPTESLNEVSSPAVDTMLDALRWRAGVEDCLGDVWDVIGEPALEIDECNALYQFFEAGDLQKTCTFCLGEFTREKLSPEDHECLLLGHVRAKWPPIEWPPPL